MAKPLAGKIAGYTPAEWKQHMDADEDWTERLEGLGDAGMQEVLAALEHGDTDARALACYLAYGLGAAGLGERAQTFVDRLAHLAGADKVARVRARARIAHETLAADVERVKIFAELPWLAQFDPGALEAAAGALDDPREAVRLHLYIWWANAAAVPESVRTRVVARLRDKVSQEPTEVVRQAAQMALARLG